MKIREPAVHLDHMLRQTRMHHVQLSSMADLKANMLLTIASVVLTLTAPHMMKPQLKWAAVVLIMFCLLTVVLAVYSVMPKMTIKTKKADIKNPFFNILFFGDFVNLEYDEYESAMEDLMNDFNKTYEAEVRELYTLGSYLAHKKYRYLKYAYMSFLLGLVSSATVMVLTNL